MSDSTSSSESLIDVNNLIEELGIAGTCRTAEEYFTKVEETLLAKPFNSIGEASDILASFSQVLKGLELIPGMRVLDFGAGSCWLSKCLTQLGAQVVALDVSKTALGYGKALYEHHPVFGNQPHPTFLHYDGHKIELGDKTIDRIVCFDAFHHVPNPDEVLKEFSRVLKDGGIAAFSEPGPDHSHSSQAQSDMRMYRTVEKNIILREIWEHAKGAGFTEVKVSLFNPSAFYLSIDDFESFLASGPLPPTYGEHLRHEMLNRRLFFLRKGENLSLKDSLSGIGLKGEIKIDLKSNRTRVGEFFQGTAIVKNIGTSKWLPSSELSSRSFGSLYDSKGVILRERLNKGAVHLGAHLFDSDGILIERDYFRAILKDQPLPVLPGETVNVDLMIPSPSKGEYILEFDLVSEWVCWFESNGSETVKARVAVA